MPVQLFVSVTRFIVQYRIAKLLESALFYKKLKGGDQINCQEQQLRIASMVAQMATRPPGSLSPDMLQEPQLIKAWFTQYNHLSLESCYTPL